MRMVNQVRWQMPPLPDGTANWIVVTHTFIIGDSKD